MPQIERWVFGFTRKVALQQAETTEISEGIQKAWLAVADIDHLYCRRLLEEHIYSVMVLLYAGNAWSNRAEDADKSSVS